MLLEIAVDNIDRAISLAQKQTKAYDAISKVQQELTESAVSQQVFTACGERGLILLYL